MGRFVQLTYSHFAAEVLHRHKNYLATAMERFSRITTTFTCPG